MKAVIDAVGCEAHHTGYIDAVLDKAKKLVGQPVDRGHALREAIMCCRKAGTMSVPGVYANFPDKFPTGAFLNKAQTMRTGQTHMQKDTRPLLEKVLKNDIDISFLVTYRLPIEDWPAAYRTFRDKKDNCIKLLLKPWGS